MTMKDITRLKPTAPARERSSGASLHHDFRTSPGETPPPGFAMGLFFHRLDNNEALRECERLLATATGTPCHMVTANMDFVARAARSREIRELLLSADRVVCDGQPIVWASRLLPEPLPERVAGSDLTPALLQLAAEKGHRVYILGPDGETAAVLRERLPQLYPGLQLAGIASPPYSPIEEWDNDAYLREIEASRANLLFVCLGFPKQDLWIRKFRSRMPHVSLAIGVGASLDFLAGKQIRAPRWVQRIGMEWSWRLLHDPGRLLRRYALDFRYLLTELHAQHKYLRERPVSGRRRMRFLNGLTGLSDADRNFRVIRHLSELPAALSQPLPAGLVLDLSDRDRLDPAQMVNLLTFYRSCRAAQVAPAIFNATPKLERYLEHLGLENTIPAFHDPLLVAAWAEGLSRTTPGKATIPEIPVAARLEIDATLEACEKDLHRLLQLDTFSKCPEIHFDLSRLETVSVLSAVRLVHLRKRIEGHLARERSPEDAPHVQLRSPQPSVAHLFEMIGLSPELTSGTPAPATLPDREPLLSEPDEADLVLPS